MGEPFTEPLSDAPLAAPPTPPPPTADEFFGPKQKPTAGEFFGPPPVNANALALGGADMDEYFSQGSAGRILDLFGHGAAQGWGTEPLDIGPETQKFLRDAGIFNDYEKGQNSLIREFNERLLRGAAIGANTIMRAPGALLHGLYEVEPAIGGPLLAGAEAFPLGHVTAFPTRIAPLALERARDLGIIGRNEAAFRDGVDVTAEAERALRPTGVESPTEQVVTPPAPEPPPLDVHGAARQVAPEIFAEYDALAARKKAFRGRLDDFAAVRAADPRAIEAQNRIDTILGKVGGDEDRLTSRAAARLATARGDLADFLGTDTPEMAQIRQGIQTIDVAMRDLAPDVSAAYRTARERMPPEAAPPAAEVAAPAPEPAASFTVAAPEAPHSAVPSQGSLFDDPLAMQRRGELTAARAGEIRDELTRTPPAEGAADHLDPEIWKVVADNLAKAEASREGGISVVADQMRYLPDDGVPKNISEREAMAVIARALDAEAARGGDVGSFLAEADAAYRAAGRGTPPDVTAAEASRAAPIAPAGVVGEPTEGIPFMITVAMRRGLADLGFSAEQIRDMTPAAAHDALRNGTGPGTTAAEPPKPAAATPQAAGSPAQALPAGGIAEDVAQNLAAAGRPTPEAAAAGALVQAHYEARAERFGGAKGTAEDLYLAEAPEVRAGRGARAAEYAQRQQRELGQGPARYVERDGERFVARADGSDVLGEITPEISAAIGREAGPIRLPEGNAAYGEAHVEARLGQAIRTAGYPDAASFINDIVSNFSAVYRGRQGRLVLTRELPGAVPRTAVVELRPIGDGAHWSVTTAHLQRSGQVAKREPLWRRPGPAATPEGPLDSLSQGQSERSIKPPGEPSKPELDQVKRGKIRLATDTARAAITLFKDADASTFLHETGHHWLEELMADAADARAPADLLADAATVRAWLGTKEGEVIPTRAHEKFARGFERYMMEGHAPSVALAGVFAKFRDWLVRIYQSVDKLRSPINDDIRGVFDRLLATRDEGTVVAPDREAPGVGVETPPREMVGSPSVRPGATGAFERVPAEPMRLVDFLKKNGGLRDDTFSRRINTARGREDARANPTDIRTIAGDHPRAKGLIRARAGMAHDEAALKAWEAGYFPEHTGDARPTINDLYNAIGEDLNGPARYSAADAQAVADYHEALNRNAEIDRLANTLGINARDYTPEQFFDLAAEQMSREAQAREIGSQEAANELSFDEAERKAEEWAASRGDAWEADVEDATTTARTLEDLERAHEQEREAAANAREGEGTPSGAPGSAIGDQGSLQEVDRSRGRGAGNTGRTGPAPSEAPAGPHATFAPHDDGLVDKAGNIRLDNLNQPEDINVAIRDAAEKNEDFIGARRGVISDGQVLDLADALGMDAGTLSQRKLGQAFNAEEIVAARKLLIQSATTVRDAMAKAATGDDAAVLAYAEAKARHMMIQEQVAGLTAEAGRALRAFRSLGGMKEAQELGAFIEQTTGRSLNQLRREAQLGMDLDTPQKLSKFINDSRRATFKDMMIEFWINALLSGPVTHVKNIVGNMAVAVNSVLETGGAAVVGTIRHAITGAEDYATFGEAKARLFGLVQGAQDGVVAAAKAFKNEESLTGTQTIEQVRFRAIPSATVQIGGRDVEIGGKQVRLPGRLLTAEDEFFKAIAVRQELNAIGWREATRAGLEGDAFNAKVAEVVSNPTDAQMLAAKQNADYQTFTRALGRTGRAIQNFANSHPLAKIVVPFIRTPINLLKYAQERSPLGLFSQEVRNNLAAGGIARDTQIARMTMGTMAATAAAGLFMQGLITDGGPSDPKERAAKMLTGWRPYSVKIGDMYYAYDWLDPFSTSIGIASDLAAAAVHLSDTDADVAEIGAGLIASLSKNIMSKASLRGASDLIVALTDPARYGPHYVQGLLGSLVPSVVARTAASQDPLQREARTALDAVRARIPGLRQDLFPRRDVWGEPMANEGALGPDMLSPVRQAAVNADPVNQALLRAGYFPAKLEHKIRGVELTDQQYDDFARIGGRFAKMRLDGIVANPGFAQLPAVTQHEMIRSALMHAHEAARSLVMMQSVGTDNDIVKKATDAKVEGLQGASPERVKALLKAP